MNEPFSKIIEEFYASHNIVSYRTTWHRQHLFESILDLQGFMDSISTSITEEATDYKKSTYARGHFQLDQPFRIRYIKIVFIFTLLERRSRALCNLIHELKKTNKQLDDYKGALMIRMKHFIREHLTIDFDRLDAWQDLLTLQKVRDCIIHCGGNVTESRDQEFLSGLAATSGHFGISERGYLTVDEEYMGIVEVIVMSFVELVLDELYHTLSNSKQPI